MATTEARVGLWIFVTTVCVGLWPKGGRFRRGVGLHDRSVRIPRGETHRFVADDEDVERGLWRLRRGATRTKARACLLGACCQSNRGIRHHKMSQTTWTWVGHHPPCLHTTPPTRYDTARLELHLRKEGEREEGAAEGTPRH